MVRAETPSSAAMAGERKPWQWRVKACSRRGMGWAVWGRWAGAGKGMPAADLAEAADIAGAPFGNLTPCPSSYAKGVSGEVSGRPPDAPTGGCGSGGAWSGVAAIMIFSHVWRAGTGAAGGAPTSTATGSRHVGGRGMAAAHGHARDNYRVRGGNVRAGR